MKKYNEVVEFHNSMMDKCQKVSEEQQAILKQAHETVEKVVGGALDELTKGLEEKVKDWTAEDYDQFISISEHDERLDNRDILTISTAYARTHEADKERVHNSVCKKALFEMALDSFSEMLDTLAGR